MLSKILENEAFSSPFIFEGPDRDHTYEVAVKFAKDILTKYSSPTTSLKLEKGSHPDFFIFKPEGTRSMHSITDIKRLIDDAVMPPYEGKYKIYLVVDSEAMLPIHANALLKTLEDKNDHTIILLTTTDTTQLLPTIVSRCKVVSLSESATDRKIDAEFQRQVFELLQLAHEAQISKAFAKAPAIEKIIDAEGVRKMEDFIDLILVFYRDLPFDAPNRLSFTEMSELTSQLQLGYQRHVKIRSLIEQTVIRLYTSRVS